MNIFYYFTLSFWRMVYILSNLNRSQVVLSSFEHNSSPRSTDKITSADWIKVDIKVAGGLATLYIFFTKSYPDMDTKVSRAVIVLSGTRFALDTDTKVAQINGTNLPYTYALKKIEYILTDLRKIRSENVFIEV